MSAPRLRHYFVTLVAVGTYAQRVMIHRRGRELQLLQRRLAAARLGIGCPRRALRQSLYEDLR